MKTTPADGAAKILAKVNKTAKKAITRKNTVDKFWFKYQLELQKISQRQFALRIGMDPSAFSLMLDGKRDVSSREVVVLAKNFGVNPIEVLLRLGAFED